MHLVQEHPKNRLSLRGNSALRIYLISSNAVRAETLRFKESGVKDIVAKVLLPLWNSYRFFDEQVLLLKSTQNIEFSFDPIVEPAKVENVMDRWILASCQSLLHFVNQEMAGEVPLISLESLVALIDSSCPDQPTVFIPLCRAYCS